MDEEIKLFNGSYSVCVRHSTLLYINTSPNSIQHWRINHHSKYMSTKFKTEICSLLSLGNILSSWHPRLWNYLGALKKKITRVKRGEIVRQLKLAEAVLVQGNIVSKGLVYNCCKYVIHPATNLYTETFYPAFSCIETWFTDPGFIALEKKKITNLTLVINYMST